MPRSLRRRMLKTGSWRGEFPNEDSCLKFASACRRSSRCRTLGPDIDRVERLARRHEEAVALGPAKAQVGGGLGKADAADQLALRGPHGHSAVTQIAAAIARHPEIAIDVAARSVRPAFDPVDHEIGEGLLVRELVVRSDVEDVHVALAAGPGIARALTGADHIELLVVV